MDCHKCAHQAAIQAGKYRLIAFADTPCSRCDGFSKWPYVIEYTKEVVERVPSPEASVPELAFPEEGGDGPVLPVDVLVEAMAAFLTLPPKVLEVFRLRYQGWTLVQISQALGVSEDAVGMRYARALKRWPKLAVLFVQSKVRRQRLLATARRARVRQ